MPFVSSGFVPFQRVSVARLPAGATPATMDCAPLNGASVQGCPAIVFLIQGGLSSHGEFRLLNSPFVLHAIFVGPFRGMEQLIFLRRGLRLVEILMAPVVNAVQLDVRF